MEIAPGAQKWSIEVRRISKSYGTVVVLKDISFVLKAGESMVILGPSGSGKTTLLRLLAGLEFPDTGEIYMEGKLVSRPCFRVLPHQRKIGMVFQSPALWPHMTVAENIGFGLRNWPKKKVKARVDELLVQMGLDKLKDRYPNEISGGQAQRVALARALAPRPRHLFLDEPLTNLNNELKENLLGLIKGEAVQNRSTLIYVTHDHEEATVISQNTLILKENYSQLEENGI